MADSDTEGSPFKDERIGMVLEKRYKIVRKLGEGGMGAVYEGEHLLIKRRVAIKCLHAEIARDPDLVERFHREALAATAIGHENIIEVTDMGAFDDGAMYIVLEYLEGREWLDDITRQGPAPLGQVVHIISQVCDALSAAHKKGIVHRDLKPENIHLIKRRGDDSFAKVLDFGIAKFKSAAPDEKGITKTGVAMGTPYYMAPEQLEGRKDVDHRADIYALGAVMFQALTGRHPYDADALPMLVARICFDPIPPISHYRPDLPGEIEQIVTTMLAKRPEKRFQSCTAVAEALAPFADVAEEPVLNRETWTPAESLASSDSVPPAGWPQAATEGTDPGEDDAELEPGEDDAGLEPGEDDAGLEPGEGRRSGLFFGVMTAIAVVVTAGAVVLVAPLLMSEPEEPEPVIVTPPLPPLPPEEQEPPPQEETKTVPVSIKTLPGQATLRLDGQPIKNPFVAQLALGKKARVLEAQLEGYELWKQTVVIDGPKEMMIELVAAKGAPSREAGSDHPRPVKRQTQVEDEPRADTDPLTEQPEKTPPDPQPDPVEKAPEPVSQPPGKRDGGIFLPVPI